MTKAVQSVMAPRTVSLGRTIRLKIQGRSDAKDYRGLQDFTRTHALIVAQNVARSGQRAVNQWVIQSIDPIQTGNARILVQVEAIQEAINRLKKEGDDSGRKQRTLKSQAQYLENQARNFESQYRANIAKAQTFLLQGEQAIGSWANYYEQMAGIYTRARAAKLKVDISSVEAEVPPLESVELVNIHGFDSPSMPFTTKGKK